MVFHTIHAERSFFPFFSPECVFACAINPRHFHDGIRERKNTVERKKRKLNNLKMECTKSDLCFNFQELNFFFFRMNEIFFGKCNKMIRSFDFFKKKFKNWQNLLIFGWNVFICCDFFPTKKCKMHEIWLRCSVFGVWCPIVGLFQIFDCIHRREQHNMICE